MLAAEIPDGVLFGLLPVSFVMVVGLMAWIVRELGRISIVSGRQEERLDDHDRRISHLEMWRRP